MTFLEWLLAFIAVILFMCWINLSQINTRLKQRFPTEKEQDYEWSRRDPGGIGKHTKMRDKRNDTRMLR